MKNSRTSLNKPFYDWIKEVREANKKIAELEDKLYYYNVKLIGYNSPNFEPRLSRTKPEYKDIRYIWIDKIKNTQEKINKKYKIIKDFQKFRNMLNCKQKLVLNDYFNKNENIYYSKTYKYVLLNDIAYIYMDNIRNK